MAEVWGNAGAGSALRHDAVYTPSSHKLAREAQGGRGWLRATGSKAAPRLAPSIEVGASPD